MDVQQWSAIVHEHSALVWRTTYRFCGNHADAADCFQETFVAAWRYGGRHAVSNWAGLLTRLATARSLDQLRRRRRWLRQVDIEPADESASTRPDPLAQAQISELAVQLRAALALLPAQQAEIYCLRHLSGLGYAQIAAELSITVSAVGVNLHRAQRRLRQLLQSLAPDQSVPGGSP